MNDKKVILALGLAYSITGVAFIGPLTSPTALTIGSATLPATSWIGLLLTCIGMITIAISSRY